MGHTRDPRAVEPLIGALDDQDPWTRVEVVLALAQIGDVRAVPVLERAASFAQTEFEAQQNLHTGVKRLLMSIPEAMEQTRPKPGS